jgi:carbonic anhydrase
MLSRRGFLVSTLGAAALPVLTAGATSPTGGALSTGTPLDALTPADVLNAVLEGNRRFLAGQRQERDVFAQQRTAAAVAEGQPPKVVFLTCLDSRALMETVCDLGVGESLNVQIAGNVVNEDILGSMESATVSAGAKLVMVVGHTSCGVIRAAIDQVRLGHLTSLMVKIGKAIDATSYQGEKSSRNPAYLDAVARTHVRLTMDAIRAQSPILRELEKQGGIAIAGSMYDHSTRRVSLVRERTDLT